MIYNGSSSATVPSGTMIWSLSSCNKTMLSTSGTLSQTGTPSADTDLVNKAYVDNAIEEASVGGSGSTGDASTHNHDDRYYTESESNSRFYGTSRGTLNTNTCYDGKLYMVASGSNVPCGSNYGVVLGMPYRQLTGNSTPDFGAQIFLSTKVRCAITSQLSHLTLVLRYFCLTVTTLLIQTQCSIELL
jgi:hypothetical protein